MRVDVRNVLAAVDEARGRIADLEAENDELRGRLRECRRLARAARRDCADAQAKANRDASYWRHLMFAVCGLTGALVCLLHTIAIVWATR
jgi:hypothetical protein